MFPICPSLEISIDAESACFMLTIVLYGTTKVQKVTVVNSNLVGLFDAVCRCTLNSFCVFG